MSSVWQDLRYGVRTLVVRPGFTAIAVLTIALGIGATSSIFSVVSGVLLEPIPLPDSGELVVPEVIAPTGFQISLSIPNFKDWREKNRTFESFAANRRASRTLTGGDRPEVIVMREVLGDWFEALDVSAARGRVIASEETWAGAAPIAVVTHGFWQRRLAGDPDVLGRTIVLDGESFEIVGVMPPDFRFPSADTEVFVPMGYYSERLCWEQRGCSQGTWAIGRLDEEVTLERAQADLDRVAREIAAAEGEEVAVPRLSSLSDAYIGDLRGQLWILMGAVGFVLLIACANVGGLLLSRGEERRREIALRTALGAGRGRVVRQLLTESVLLALAGGAVGVALAYGGVRLLVPAIADDVPSILVGRIGLDAAVLGFTLLASIGAGLVFGLAPAWRTSGIDLAGELKEGGRGGVGSMRQRARSVLVAAEVGLSLVLLIGAALMLQSLRRLQDVPMGFDPAGVFTAEVSLPRIRYPDRETAWRFYEELLPRVQSLPGVRSASMSNTVPLAGSSWEQGIIPEGVAPEPENFRSVLFYMVTPEHFETLGIPLLRGRGFTGADREGRDRICIIDETMAEAFWPGEDPIGKRVSFELQHAHGQEEPVRLWRTVVGIVPNVRHYELESPSRITVYVPMAQSGGSWTASMKIVARTDGDPGAITEPVRRELARMDPDVPLSEVRTMDGYVADALSGTRVVGGLLGVFSAIALALSAIGVFGVMSVSVVQRVREIGVRMALGARASDVVRMISTRGLRLALIGVAVGVLAAVGLTRLLTGVLYEVDPVDPIIYSGVAGFLIVVSGLSAYLPARRATRVDPATVLREE